MQPSNMDLQTIVATVNIVASLIAAGDAQLHHHFNSIRYWVTLFVLLLHFFLSSFFFLFSVDACLSLTLFVLPLYTIFTFRKCRVLIVITELECANATL